MRTLCILLTSAVTFLFASANEIPLILEETIQLPQATPYWDVMPHFFGHYFWMTAVDSPDTTTLISWGRTDQFGEDSVVASPGNPTFIGGYFGEDYVPCAIVSTHSRRSYQFGDDIALAYAINLTTHSHIAEPMVWPSNWGGIPEYDYTVSYFYRINSIECAPSPPMISNRISAIVAISYYTYGLAHNVGTTETQSTRSIYYHDLLSGSGAYDQWLYGQGIASVSQWSGVEVVGNAGQEQVDEHFVSSHSTYYSSSRSICNAVVDSLQQLSSVDLGFSDSDPGIDQNIVFYDFIHGRSLLVSKYGLNGLLEAFTANTSVSIWILQDSYQIMLAAYVLFGESNEQLLAYDSARLLFDIIKIEDGSIWGQTSELPNNYDEIKIIGRYHNDYRRLAVRYDDEIRIYAFGEPIIEDADESPSVPYDYGFSIYPNPFNPSTTISFSLPVYEDVKLSIFNTLGQEVTVLTNELLSPGEHVFTFEAEDLPSGLYFARLQAGSLQSTKKLVLLK